jgi:hypothetical protein
MTIKKRGPQLHTIGAKKRLHKSRDLGTIVPAGISLSSTPFVGAIALSAFLLFCLEFLAARLLLPVFGGAPAVWTTTLAFFTTVLFLGYAYAHVVATKLSLRAGGLIHVSMAIAIVALTVASPESIATLRQENMPPAINVLVALTVLAGPAAFLLAATTPLLSAWFASGRHSPWWLYAVSNGASFAALVGYPLVISPLVALSVQRSLLVVGLAIFVAMLIWARFSAPTQNVPRSQGSGSVTDESLTWQRQVLWILAAAIPAGLMSATTMFISTDLVAAPLIWMGPLGLYLASYVVAFSARGRSILRMAEWLTPAAATLMWLPFARPGWPILSVLVIVNTALFTLAVAIHGRLALDRPSEGHITRFYLLVSLGGLLATAFVALVAPVTFSLIYEYPLLIAAGMIVLVLLPTPLYQAPKSLLHEPLGAAKELARRLVPYVLAAGVLSAGLPAESVGDAMRVLLFGALVVMLSVTPRVGAIATVAALELFIIVGGVTPLLRERSFFGVTQVFEAGSAHSLYSGTTLHGFQFTDGRASEPASYYVKSGPLGEIFTDARSRKENLAIGVVGLGAGTIAAYAEAGDTLSFFELDEAVINIATDPRYFTFLQDAAVTPRIVSGDGRLSLESEPPESFDILVLDAFSSDVVPAHLITREAMALYRSLLRPGGLLALHVSNRYYNLASAVGSAVQWSGMACAGSVATFDEAKFEGGASSPSFWVVAGDAEDVRRFTGAGWFFLPAAGHILSDDHSDLTRFLDFGRK